MNDHFINLSKHLLAANSAPRGEGLEKGIIGLVPTNFPLKHDGGGGTYSRLSLLLREIAWARFLERWLSLTSRLRTCNSSLLGLTKYCWAFFGQIFSKRVKILTNTNLVASRHIIKETAIVPVDVRRSKTSQLLMLPNASTIFLPIAGPQGFQIRLPFLITMSGWSL